MSILHKPTGPAILQLNMEGLTRSKCEVIHNMATSNSVSVILLQETHIVNKEKIKIFGYTLIEEIPHQRHGIATLVRNDLVASVSTVGKSVDGAEIEWISISINSELTITNFYKPQNALFVPPPIYDHPAIYSGDFNCHHTSWGYARNGLDGDPFLHMTETVLYLIHCTPS